MNLFKDFSTVGFGKFHEDFLFELLDNAAPFIVLRHVLTSGLVNLFLVTGDIGLKHRNLLIQILLLARELLDEFLLFRLGFFAFFGIVCAIAVGHHFFSF